MCGAINGWALGPAELELRRLGSSGSSRNVCLKYLPLVCAGLWRKPARTILTLLSIAVAFLLFGLLRGVNAGFDHAIAGIRNRN